MHLWIIITTLILATGLRFLFWHPAETWEQRQHRALSAFLIPPLLLLITAITMIQMGTEGVMLGIPVGEIGFVLGMGFIATSGVLLIHLGLQGWRSLQQVRAYPHVNINNYSSRLLDVAVPFAGQVGFWHSELVVSQGLLNALTPEQVTAVLTHEKAHATYRDTFWFFWLGWLRTLTCWLPLTHELWQELLLLREIRADRWATQSVDALVLAESLLEVIKFSAQPPITNYTPFNLPSSTNRVEERINALLKPEYPNQSMIPLPGLRFCIVLLPLLAIAFHH